VTGEFAGKSVIVTGASSGLGAALALELARRGADLALFSFEEKRQDEVARQCREAGGRAGAVTGDVTRPEDCARLVRTAVEAYGRLDCVVANAGISMWARFDETEDLALFRKLVEVNYLGAVHCIHPALPYLKQSRGLIVAITSIQARIGVPFHTGYVASKHALQGFCDTLRMELAPSGVDVLTVLPHWLRGTELRQHAFGKDGRELGTGSRKHSQESIPMEAACHAIIDAMRTRRRELVIPWKLKLLVALNLVWPARADAIIMGAVTKQDR
jgi:NAD(P)-dependent dehydrogenase (short-subunit alcohol dehydrogenase family)